MVMLAVSNALYDYWNAVKGDRGAPERDDIEPGAIRSILPDTFMLDLDDRRGFPLRIAGSRANALTLRELRGTPFLELWRDADRDQVSRILRHAAGKAEPHLLCAEARPPGLPLLEVEITLLPLRHHGSTRSRMLGSIAVESQPQWLGLAGAGAATLISSRPLELPMHERAVPKAAAVAPSRPFAQRGHLFVYSREGR
jgi:hypothetical protein